MEPIAPGRSGADPAPRSERPLGRGLEDVSHLFLSQRQAAAAAETPARAPEAPRPPQVAQRTAVLSPSSAPLTRNQLGAMLREAGAALEDGLRHLDSSVPCHPCGEIDILALDRANGLTIVDYEIAAADTLMLRGIAHVDWLVRNVHTIRRMYAGQVINFAAPPRVLLIAPTFSPLVRSAARQVNRPQITWVRYHVVDMGGNPSIFFERVPDEWAQLNP
jgi:hypothetical protein